MKKKKSESFLTAPEIAIILQVSRSYAYRLLNQGKLPYIQIGKIRRVHPDDLQKFIQKSRSQQSFWD